MRVDQKRIINDLPTRQRAVLLTLLANPEASNAEIGELLGKSHKTIGNQLQAIYEALKIDGDPTKKRIALIIMFQ